MQHDDPISTLRKHIIATDGQSATAGMKAVELESALHRAGYVILPNEAALLLAYIFARGGITNDMLTWLVCEFKLGEVVKFDPAEHDGGHAHTLPGDNYLKYSERLQAVLDHGASHLAGTAQ
jgi:hypothetical protein